MSKQYKCSGCEKVFDESCFYKINIDDQRKIKRPVQYYCKKCHYDKKKIHAEHNKDHIYKKHKEWRAENQRTVAEIMYESIMTKIRKVLRGKNSKIENITGLSAPDFRKEIILLLEQKGLKLEDYAVTWTLGHSLKSDFVSLESLEGVDLTQFFNLESFYVVKKEGV